MTHPEKPAHTDSLAKGGGACNTSVILPANLREQVEQVPRANERSVGAEIRLAVRHWLDGDDRKRPA